MGKVTQYQTSWHKKGSELKNDGDDEAEALSKGYGITEEDMERILAFLEKSRFERTVDDLRPSAGKDPASRNR